MIMVSKKAYGKGRHKMQFAPMVDIVFLLLIFFLVAAQVRPTEADYDTNMPAGRGQADAKMEQKEVITIWVADVPGGRAMIRLGGESGSPVPSFDALEETLRSMKGENSLVVIDGPPDVTIQTIARVLDATVAADIPSMTFSDPEMKDIKSGRRPLRTIP